jgi:hypothetical protein
MIPSAGNITSGRKAVTDSGIGAVMNSNAIAAAAPMARDTLGFPGTSSIWQKMISTRAAVDSQIVCTVLADNDLKKRLEREIGTRHT